MDQHHSHEVLDLLMLAREEGIVIFFDLPPHTSHWLQPLDKSCFGPLTKRYNTACSQFMSKGPNYMVSKATFAKLFHQAWSETMVPHGFFVIWIYPFNPAAIPGTAFACSVASKLLPSTEPTNQATPSESMQAASTVTETETSSAPTVTETDTALPPTEVKSVEDVWLLSTSTTSPMPVIDMSFEEIEELLRLLEPGDRMVELMPVQIDDHGYGDSVKGILPVDEFFFWKDLALNIPEKEVCDF